MSTLDTSKLSYSELIALAKELEQQIESKRDEELKVLADGYAKKIEAAGFTIVEAIEALKPYLAGRGETKRKASGSAPVLFRDPANSENTWSGRGRAAKWLADYEAQGRSRDEFKI